MTPTLVGRVERWLAVLAVAGLVLAVAPATGSHAQEDGDLDLPPTGDDEDLVAQQQPGLPVEDGEGPEVTEYEGETGTIVQRSGDGLVPSFRYRGVGRHDTAGLIALDGRTFRAENPNVFRGADDVIVARADDFPDSMAGATLAGAVAAPVLLVDTTGDVQADTREALDTIEPSRIFALGGTAAISEQVANDLEDLAYVDTVERIAGADRFATAAEVAGRAAEEQPVPDVGGDTVALLATGEEFADALTGGQIAYAGPFPLLLTPHGVLAGAAEDALAELEVDRVLVLGGEAAVSADVATTLENLGYTVERLAGADRTTTAVEIAEFALDELGFTDEHVSVARGNDFADALAIAPHAGEEGHPLLISATQAAFGQQEVVDFYTDRSCTVEDLHVSGGFAAVTTPLEQQVREAATGAACDVDVPTADQAAETGEQVEIEADVLTSLGESATAGIDVAFSVEPQGPAGDDTVICDPQVDETDADGRASCTFQTEEGGLYEITATVTTAEGGEASDSVLVGVGAEFEPASVDGAGGEELLFQVASEREVGEGFEPSPNPLGPAGGDAQGEAQLTVDPESDQACLMFVAFNTAGSFEAFEADAGTLSVHLHRSDAEPTDLAGFAKNGDVEFGFSETPDPSPLGTVVYNEVCEDTEPGLAQEIVDAPGDFYINAHTDAWPGGNLRGQVNDEWDGEDRSDAEPADTGDGDDALLD